MAKKPSEPETTPELVPTKQEQYDQLNEEFSVYAVMDHLDDEAFVTALEDDALPRCYAYEFKEKKERADGTKYEVTIQGLSKEGVDAATLEMAHRNRGVIRLDKPDIRETEDAWDVTVRASRWVLKPMPDGTVQEIELDSNIGAKHQAKMMAKKKRKGEQRILIPDPFALEKAITKAQRNAKIHFLTHKVKKLIIDRALNDGKVRRITQGEVKEREKDIFITQKQVGRLWAIADQVGLKTKAGKAYFSDWLAKNYDGIDTTSAIRWTDYDNIIAWIMDWAEATDKPWEKKQD